MNLANDQSDFLLGSLFELAGSLKKYDIPLIVGGGLSLYIRTKFIKKKRSPRYPFHILQRSTKDIDMFLTSDIIVDHQKFEAVREVIENLNYSVKTKYHQFYKEVEFAKSRKEVVLDLLAEPPLEEDKNKVKIKGYRIRPKDVENLHGYLTMESKGIYSNLIKVDEFVEDKNKTNFQNVYIPSSFDFIILKLHAFRDRKDDESSEFGRHHAYDIFTTITDMSEEDWEVAKSLIKKKDEDERIRPSQNIVEEFFSDEIFFGIIRLKENEIYKRNQMQFDKYISDFILDLKELFL